MKRCLSAILLVLSVGLLAAGSLSTAVADEEVETIRLPSQGLADEVATAAAAREKVAEKKRPWRCCDKRICFWFRGKPTCNCVDQVDQCDDACTDCQTVHGDPPKYICRTSYTGDPGPKCTKVDGNGDDMSTGAAATGTTTETAVSERSVGVRPKCCDLPICITRMAPNVCTCKDKVLKCAKTCERCNKEGSLYVCKDVFPVLPAEATPPSCTNTHVSRGN